MKLCYLSDLPALGQLAESGVPKVSETLLREYEQMPNLEVEVVHLVDGLPAAVTEERGNVRYHYFPCASWGKAATLHLREKSKLIASVATFSPDVIHGQPPVYYMQAATKCGLPSVVTVHGLVSRELRGLSPLSKQFWRGQLHGHLLRSTVRRAKNIISISPYVTEYLKKVDSPAVIWDIPNPVDVEFFDIPPMRERRLNILCVGTVTVRKNQTMLVEACHILKSKQVEFSCMIAGNQDPALAKQLQTRINECGMAGTITLTGLVSKAELLRLYEWATLVVLPSLEETAPLSLIQAMAANRPALGANSAGIPSLLQKGQMGTLFGNSPEAFAVEMERTIRSPGRFLEMASQAAGYARVNFHPTSVARATVDVYRNISEQRSATSPSKT